MAMCRKFTPHLPLPTLAAAALVASAPLALAQTAGQPEGMPDAAAISPATTPARAALNQAQRLLSEGRPVAAREAIVRAFQNDQGGVAAADPLRSEAMRLLAQTGKQIQRLDPADLSLQKAELALEDADVRTAERHLQAVLKSATNSSSQHTAATRLMAKLEQRRTQLQEVVVDALVQAERDFLSGRYAQARSGFALVDRSGVTLTSAQQLTLDTYQLKLVELADTNSEVFGGQVFGHRATLGMMQPGVVRRQDRPPAQPEQPAEPAPAAEPVQPEPIEPPPPVAVPPPSQPEPTGDRLVQAAHAQEARSLLRQADEAFDQRNLNLARSRYQIVLDQYRDFLPPELIQHAQNRLSETGVRAGMAQPPRPEEVLEGRRIAKEQAQAKFANFMDVADRALQSGNISEARNNAAAARLEINAARDLFAEPEFETYQDQVANFLANVDRTEQQLLAAQAAQRERELQERERTIRESQIRERERRVVELIDRARAYQAEKRYSEALQAVDQLLFLDPLNPTGLLLRDVYVDILIYMRSNEIYTTKHIHFAHNELDNQEASIPPAGLMNFPADWPAISVRRGEPLQFAETPENRRVLAELGNRRIPSVAFADNSLQDVVQFFQTITNLNVDVDWTSLEEVGIQRDTPVSLNLTNVSARTLLDRVVEKISGFDRLSRADWAVNDGVVTIASKDKIDRNTVLVIYDIRDLLVEIPDYRDVPAIDLQQALQASQQGGGGGGQGPFRDTEGDQQQQLVDREERMDFIINIITSNIDFEGWQENGGDVGRIQRYPTHGSLIITNTPKNHRLVSGLLSKLREVRAMQINVETRFLLVNQDWFEQIGFDIDVVFNANNNQMRAARAANPDIRPTDFFPGGTLSRLGIPPQGAGAAVSGGQPTNFSPIGTISNSLGLAEGLAPATDWSGAILSGAPALGIAGQFLDDVQVDFLIQATQADRRSLQLTAPRLTFTNGQAASIYVATQVAFISELEPVVGDSAVGFDPTVGVVTEGVTMLVEGTVTADRRYVTMNVDAGVARIDGFAAQAVSAVAGGQLVSSAATQSFIQLPQVTVTRVRSTVTVPDQGTLLMGGQRLVTEFEVETGVPVLSKIPIINRFFTNRVESKEEQTLLILIKPTILIQNEEEERHFPGLLDSLRSGLGG